MAEDRCAEMALLLQADLDGELTAAEAAGLVAHVAGCARCTAVQADLLALSQRVRAEVPRFELPAGLADRVRAQIGVAAAPAGPLPLPLHRRTLKGRVAGRSFGAGFALAACLALAFVLPRAAELTGDVVDSHVRALQPGHLMDVASTDQHTVKPWFDGRIDFAPPVKDLAAARFPLLGGRLDYLAGHPVAALVYGRDKHVIDLYVWPGAAVAGEGSRAGYNFQRWAQGGMVFWAVSDLNAKELGEFVRLWQAG